MYILFEKRNARSESEDISEYDAMGYTNNEQDAMRWRDDNAEYRKYKYCTDTLISNP